MTESCKSKHQVSKQINEAQERRKKRRTIRGAQLVAGAVMKVQRVGRREMAKQRISQLQMGRNLKAR